MKLSTSTPKKAIRYPKRLLSTKHPAMRGASVTLILETERQLKHLLADKQTEPELKERLLATSVRLISAMNAAATANQAALLGASKPAAEPIDEDEEESAFGDWAPETESSPEDEEEE